MNKYTVRQCKDARWRVVTPNGATIMAAAYLTRTAAQRDADDKNRICGK